MKNDLYEQGPALCFELLDKIYGQNEEEELIWGQLTDYVNNQFYLSELSFVQQSFIMTKKWNNSNGKRNSIWIQ